MDEALTFLQDHCWFDPPLDRQQAIALWSQHRDRVHAMPVREPKPTQRHPIPSTHRALVTEFLRRFRGQWDVTDVLNIDPLELVAYQTVVVADRADHHHSSHAILVGGRRSEDRAVRGERATRTGVRRRCRRLRIRGTLPGGDKYLRSGYSGRDDSRSRRFRGLP